MIAGIIFMALGLKKTLEHTDEHLKMMVAVALAGGIALYLLAHILFRLRLVRSIAWPRIIAVAALVAIIPFSGDVSALAFLAATVAIMLAVIVYEGITNAEARRRFLASGDLPEAASS